MCSLKAIGDLADHIDWRDPNDRRRIAASLVNVVYLLQQCNGKTSQKTPEKWCKKLKFDVVELIKEEGELFGAIFKRDRAEEREASLEVIAFRGTLLDKQNTMKDMRHNWKIATACHGKSGRVYVGLDAVRSSIGRPGTRDTWIAGHSLGAAIAIAIARKLGREEREKIDAHFFNPPFVSPRLPEIKFFEKIGKIILEGQVEKHSFNLPLIEKVFKGIEDARKWAQVKLGLNDHTKLDELCCDFISVRNWIPNMYVNEDDVICSSYIHYFKVMERLYNQKSGKLVVEDMKYIFCYEVAKQRTPWHLVPSAKLFLTNHNLFKRVKDAKHHHDLSKWLSRSLELEMKEYVLPFEG